MGGNGYGYRLCAYLTTPYPALVFVITMFPSLVNIAKVSDPPSFLDICSYTATYVT